MLDPGALFSKIGLLTPTIATMAAGEGVVTGVGKSKAGRAGCVMTPL
jgi:hypothetical protein